MKPNKKDDDGMFLHRGSNVPYGVSLIQKSKVNDNTKLSVFINLTNQEVFDCQILCNHQRTFHRDTFARCLVCEVFQETAVSGSSSLGNVILCMKLGGLLES